MTKELWIMVVDVVVSLILYFVGKYAAVGIFEDVKFLISVLQPLILALIGILVGQRVITQIRILRVK